MDAGFVQSLVDLIKVGETRTLIYSGSLVYEARERLANMAVSGGYDYALWFDSDMMFPSTTMMDLIAQDKDMITGVCAARRPPYRPCVYREVDGKPQHILDFGNDLFEVDYCGFAVVLMKVNLLREMFEKFGTCFSPFEGWGEDMSFCIRAKELGYTIWANPNIDIGHIGKRVYYKDDYRSIDVRQG